MSTPKPFGMEFLEEIVAYPSVSGNDEGCKTTWSNLKASSDDIDGTSNDDPCGEMEA